MEWCGVVRCGVAWCGMVWSGVAWCGVVWCGVVSRGVVCCDMYHSCTYMHVFESGSTRGMCEFEAGPMCFMCVLT